MASGIPPVFSLAAFQCIQAHWTPREPCPSFVTDFSSCSIDPFKAPPASRAKGESMEQEKRNRFITIEIKVRFGRAQFEFRLSNWLKWLGAAVVLGLRIYRALHGGSS